MKYSLDTKILALSRDHAQMFKYLQRVFRQIARPLILQLREIMQFFGFSIEAYLFSADLRFRLLDDTNKCFVQAESMKHGLGLHEALICIVE